MPAPHLARGERSGLCDLLSQLGPDAPTLCEGWTTKDLAAHLFVRERRPLAMPGLLFSPLSRLTEISMQAALRSIGYAGLVARIRSGPPLLLRPTDELVNLVEYFVHTEDVRRAARSFEPREDPQLDAALWASLVRGARFLTRRVSGVGVELERPDGERITARRGHPTAVLSGGAQELVLFLSGRRQVAKVSLQGAVEAQQAVDQARFGL